MKVETEIKIKVPDEFIRSVALFAAVMSLQGDLYRPDVLDHVQKFEDYIREGLQNDGSE